MQECLLLSRKDHNAFELKFMQLNLISYNSIPRHLELLEIYLQIFCTWKQF